MTDSTYLVETLTDAWPLTEHPLYAHRFHEMSDWGATNLTSYVGNPFSAVTAVVRMPDGLLADMERIASFYGVSQ